MDGALSGLDSYATLENMDPDELWKISDETGYPARLSAERDHGILEDPNLLVLVPGGTDAKALLRGEGILLAFYPEETHLGLEISTPNEWILFINNLRWKFWRKDIGLQRPNAAGITAIFWFSHFSSLELTILRTILLFHRIVLNPLRPRENRSRIMDWVMYLPLYVCPWHGRSAGTNHEILAVDGGTRVPPRVNTFLELLKMLESWLLS